MRWLFLGLLCVVGCGGGALPAEELVAVERAIVIIRQRQVASVTELATEQATLDNESIDATTRTDAALQRAVIQLEQMDHQKALERLSRRRRELINQLAR